MVRNLIENDSIASKLNRLCEVRERLCHTDKTIRENVFLVNASRFIGNLPYNLHDYWINNRKNLPPDVKDIAGPLWFEVEFAIEHDPASILEEEDRVNRYRCRHCKSTLFKHPENGDWKLRSDLYAPA